MSDDEPPKQSADAPIRISGRQPPRDLTIKISETVLRRLEVAAHRRGLPAGVLAGAVLSGVLRSSIAWECYLTFNVAAEVAALLPKATVSAKHQQPREADASV